MKYRMGKALGAAVLSLTLSGCGDPGFSEMTVRQVLLQAGKTRIEGEQVTLSSGQIECGVREELWAVESLGGRSVAHLTERATSLGFADSVQLPEGGTAYVQIRGEFPIVVNKVAKIAEDDEATKIVDAQIGVQIDHTCFTAALPVMGVKKGQFTASAAPRLQFTGGPNWAYDRILH